MSSFISARRYAIVIAPGTAATFALSAGDDKRWRWVNMKVVGNFFILLFFLAICNRVCRWILTKARGSPPSLVASHGTSLAIGLLIYDQQRGPFAWPYVLLAQGICFASDGLEQRRRRTLARDP